MTLILPLLPIFVAVLCVADSIHIPIFRSPGQPRTQDDHLAEAERARTRYKLDDGSFKTFQRRASADDFPLVDHVQVPHSLQGVDSTCYCAISIGTPLSEYLGGGYISTTAANPTVITYISENAGNPTLTDTSETLSTVSGTVMTDTVRLGPYVVAANEIPTNLLQGSVSGFVGLAFQGVLSQQGPPFWQALVSEDQLLSEEISFWLNRFAGTSGVQEEEPVGGVFTLGGSNTSLYSGESNF
ncbi:hypothetical protein C8R44DRAFT_728739 [Mycena epipterygia]|nr:hypothetical protein C8R44DRAFT_728739 [Mycena epipterygia]